MQIYTVIMDDNSGHNVQVFTDKAKADEACFAHIKANWTEEFDGPMPATFDEAYDKWTEMDHEQTYLYYETHSVDDAPIIRSAKAQLGDLIEQINQMSGMFDDDDGAIENAVTDAEAWPGEFWEEGTEAQS